MYCFITFCQMIIIVKNLGKQDNNCNYSSIIQKQIDNEDESLFKFSKGYYKREIVGLDLLKSGGCCFIHEICGQFLKSVELVIFEECHVYINETKGKSNNNYRKMDEIRCRIVRFISKVKINSFMTHVEKIAYLLEFYQVYKNLYEIKYLLIVVVMYYLKQHRILKENYRCVASIYTIYFHVSCFVYY